MPVFNIDPGKDFDLRALAAGNEYALCIPQLESKAALDNVAAIAAVDGIDALFIGVADLSMGMGTTPADPDVVKLYLHALEVAHRAGKHCGNAQADIGMFQPSSQAEAVRAAARYSAGVCPVASLKIWLKYD